MSDWASVFAKTIANVHENTPMLSPGNIEYNIYFTLLRFHEPRACDGCGSGSGYLKLDSDSEPAEDVEHWIDYSRVSRRALVPKPPRGGSARVASQLLIVPRQMTAIAPIVARGTRRLNIDQSMHVSRAWSDFATRYRGTDCRHLRGLYIPACAGTDQRLGRPVAERRLPSKLLLHLQSPATGVARNARLVLGNAVLYCLGLQVFPRNSRDSQHSVAFSCLQLSALQLPLPGTGQKDTESATRRWEGWE